MNKKAKIYLVDDDKISASIAQSYLKDKYDLKYSKTGIDFLVNLDEYDPDLIILDIILPDFSGYEICQKITTNPKYENIPVILLTSLSGEDDLKEGLESGAYDYIKKPFSKIEIRARVSSALKLRENFKMLMDSNFVKEELIKELQTKIEKENEAREAIKVAENLKNMQEFAGAIAHEFSQPLQAITLYFSLIKKGKEPEKYIEKSHVMVHRIVELVNKLKNLTKIQKQDYVGSQIINIHASSGYKDDKEMYKEVKEKYGNQQESEPIRVLVVEDEETILNSTVEMLRMVNLDAEGAENGQIAWEMIQKENFQLIISDINMPVMDGSKLVQLVKESNPKLNFIFMTGYAVTEEINKSIKLADGIIHKPFSIDVLIDKIKKLFNIEIEL